MFNSLNKPVVHMHYVTYSNTQREH